MWILGFHAVLDFPKFFFLCVQRYCSKYLTKVTTCIGVASWDLVIGLDIFHTHYILSDFNGFDYFKSKLIFASKEDLLLQRKPHALMETVVFSDKYSDANMRYETYYARV